MIKCPFCGSSRLETVGGDNGDPFNRRSESTVCLECGRVVSKENQQHVDTPSPIDRMNQIKLPMISVCMTANGGGRTLKASADIPFEDGEYDLLHYDYPISRFKKLVVKENTVLLDKEVFELSDEPLSLTKIFTAYAHDKHPEQETVKIKIKVSFL